LIFTKRVYCIMRHWLWLRIYVWKSLTKHWYSRACLRPIDLQREPQYDVYELGRYFVSLNVPNLVPEQHIIAYLWQNYACYHKQQQWIIFPGCAGKIFLISISLATTWSWLEIIDYHPELQKLFRMVVDQRIQH